MMPHEDPNWTVGGQVVRNLLPGCSDPFSLFAMLLLPFTTVSLHIILARLWLSSVAIATDNDSLHSSLALPLCLSLW